VIVLRGWRLPSRTWNHWTSPWTKQLTWLRIIHSGDWYLRLALRIHSGACQKWMNEWMNEWMCWPSDACTALRCITLPRQCHTNLFLSAATSAADPSSIWPWCHCQSCRCVSFIATWMITATHCSPGCRIQLSRRCSESSMQQSDSFAVCNCGTASHLRWPNYIGYWSKPGSSTSCVSWFIWHLLARPRHTSSACYIAICHSSVSSDNSSVIHEQWSLPYADKTEVRWARL